MRYLVYAVGVLLVFFVAVGMGAMAAVVVGGQFGQAASGPSETSTLEGTGLETTGTVEVSEGTTSQPSGDSDGSQDQASEISFVHRASDENSRGDYTFIREPSINGDPDAVVLVSLTSDRENGGDAAYEHNIGVWYASGAQKWAIFNQDRRAVPAGTTFQVVVPQTSTSFVHHADVLNSAKNYTYLDNPLTNNEPDASLAVTQNWNPGGGGGVYNNHPVGVVYDGKLKKWAVVNQDGESMPEGAAFNIAVSS